MIRATIVALISVCLSLGGALDACADDEVTLEKLDGKVRVEVGGELFTEYVWEGQAKPILYPVIGPNGASMTRHFPMKDDVAAEAKDHPHHRSLWYTHGEVDDTDFWTEGKSHGRIVHAELVRASGSTLVTRNRWEKADGTVVLTDRRTLVFGVEDGARTIDFEIVLQTGDQKVVFGDTKEGTMGIRTHPGLRVDRDGHSTNSEGHRDGELWGKRARWVDYWGPVDGETVGVGIFDHPDNPRHPTWWHARNYGLVAANPFGVNYFEGKPDHTGDLEIPAGESVTFRYRFVFHEGDAEAAGIAARWEAWAAASGDAAKREKKTTPASE